MRASVAETDRYPADVALRRQPAQPVVRTSVGFRINLDADERAMLRHLLGELRDLLLAGGDQPALRRLTPPAYHLADDAEAEAEYQRLMADDLVASRLAGLQSCMLFLDPEQSKATAIDVTEEQILGFLQVVNGVRLVLGTMLDVSEDDDPQDISKRDPNFGQHQLYGYLGYLVDVTVRALGDPTSGAD